jgi:arylsulfatase
VEELLADNDVTLYDLQNDPEEMDNLADPVHPSYDAELLASINDKLNALILDEIGDDRGMRERLMQD